MTTLPDFVTTDWTRISTRDHSGDGTADILWHNDPTGANLLWTMSGTTVTATTELPTLPASYDTSVIGDFDGDGIADVLLRDSSSGGNRLLLSDDGFSPPAVLANLPAPFKARAATDINDDGNDDIFWFNTNSAGITVYQMNGNAVTGVGALASAYAVDDLLHAVFNGEATNTFDSLWFDTSANSYNITSYDAGVRTVTEIFTVESGHSYAGTGDYDGDSDPDFLFVDRSGADRGDAELVFSNGVDEIARLNYQVSDFTGLEILDGGDFDGDGFSELIGQERVSGDLLLLNAVPGTVLNETLFGSDGNDVAFGDSGADRMFGFLGNDFLEGGNGNDVMLGGGGNDRLQGNDQDDTLIGGAGDDRLDGGDRDDLLEGGPGEDLLFAGDGTDFLIGGEDADFLRGGPTSSGFDHLLGMSGDDVLFAGEAPAILDGGTGNDLLEASDDNDYLRGGSGNDVLVGGFNRDTLDGGSGDDVLIGSDRGGSSGVTDTMIGGSGADFFYLGNDRQAFYTISGEGLITDFSAAGGDKVVLTGFSSDYAFNAVGGDTEIRFGPSTILIGTVENTTPAVVEANAIFMG